MKKVIKFISLLLVAALIAIVIMNNWVNAENDDFRISEVQLNSTNVNVGDTVIVTIRFSQPVKEIQGTINCKGGTISADETGTFERSESELGTGIGQGVILYIGSSGVDTYTCSFVAKKAGSYGFIVNITRATTESGEYEGTNIDNNNIKTGTITVLGTEEEVQLPESISLSLSNGQETINVDDTTKLAITEQLPQGCTVQYVSSNPEVATIDENGNLTAINEGSTTITVTVSKDGNSKQSSLVVNVAPKAVEEGQMPVLSLASNINLEPNGKTITVKSDIPVTWSANTPSVVDVSRKSDTEAIIISNQEGKGDIIAKSGNKEARITVTVAEAPLMDYSAPSISPSRDITLNLNGTKEIELQTDENRTVTWSSSNTNVAEVDSKTGVVTAKGVGSAIITVTDTNNNKTASRTIVVTDSSKVGSNPSISEPETKVTFAISPNGKKTLNIGDTLKITANETALQWESSNSKIVTVDKEGNVKAVGLGTATVTAYSSDETVDQIRITVKSKGESAGQGSTQTTNNPVQNGDNTSSEVGEDVPATGEVSSSLFALGIVVLVIATIISRKKIK